MIRARAVRGFGGAPTGTVQTGTRTYASSVDAGIANLKAEWAIDTGFRRRPILVLMHGYGEDIAAITAAHRARFAARGFLVLVPGMRGRSSASGSRDASGREIQDILDAVEDVRAGLAEHVDPARVAIAGYSGGGGNALAALAKAPDYWSHVVAHFGPSDYGWRSTGWYNTNHGFQADLTTDVGAAPGVQPGWWRSRDHAGALAYQLGLAPRGGPRLSVYHDAGDASVSVVQSDRVRDVLDEAGLSELYEYHRSDSGDPTNARYLHGYPGDSPGVLAAEDDWWRTVLNADPWRVPYKGRALVAGFLQTKLVRVWLGLTSGGANPRTDSAGGKVHVARVEWDLHPELLENENTVRLLPLTGAVRYRVEVGAALVATGDTADPVEVVL